MNLDVKLKVVAEIDPLTLRGRVFLPEEGVEIDLSELWLSQEVLEVDQARMELLQQPELDTKYGALYALAENQLKQIEQVLENYRSKKRIEIRANLANEHNIKEKDVKEKWIAEALIEDEHYRDLLEKKAKAEMTLTLIKYAALRALEDRRIALNNIINKTNSYG